MQAAIHLATLTITALAIAASLLWQRFEAACAFAPKLQLS
jgi:hypothetical protein